VNNRSRTRCPDFAPSSKTPGGFVGQAVLVLDWGDRKDDDEYENEIRLPRSKPAAAAKSVLREETSEREAFS
jgi:hypothetical protein